MKILKRPNGIIFDNLNLEKKEYNPYSGFGNPIPLHHFHEKTDFEFLSDHFPKDHSIFNNFGNSYFYIIQS